MEKRYEKLFKEERIKNNSLTLGSYYLITVKGWVMLKKVEEGTYKIRIRKTNSGDLIATFYKPKSNKEIVSHYLDDLFLYEKGTLPDINGMELIGQCDISGKLIK